MPDERLELSRGRRPVGRRTRLDLRDHLGVGAAARAALPRGPGAPAGGAHAGLRGVAGERQIRGGPGHGRTAAGPPAVVVRLPGSAVRSERGDRRHGRCSRAVAAWTLADVRARAAPRFVSGRAGSSRAAGGRVRARGGDVRAAAGRRVTAGPAGRARLESGGAVARAPSGRLGRSAGTARAAGGSGTDRGTTSGTGREPPGSRRRRARRGHRRPGRGTRPAPRCHGLSRSSARRARCGHRRSWSGF
jgi:hypothetical protein